MSVYTTTEVAAMFNVSRGWVRKQAREGRVGSLRVGTRPITQGPAKGKNAAPLRFDETHVQQIRTLMTPAPAAGRKRRRRT